jgi:hypothetical protein
MARPAFRRPAGLGGPWACRRLPCTRAGGGVCIAHNDIFGEEGRRFQAADRRRGRRRGWGGATYERLRPPGPTGGTAKREKKERAHRVLSFVRRMRQRRLLLCMYRGAPAPRGGQGKQNQGPGLMFGRRGVGVAAPRGGGSRPRRRGAGGAAAGRLPAAAAPKNVGATGVPCRGADACPRGGKRVHGAVARRRGLTRGGACSGRPPRR